MAQQVAKDLFFLITKPGHGLAKEATASWNIHSEYDGFTVQTILNYYLKCRLFVPCLPETLLHFQILRSAQETKVFMITSTQTPPIDSALWCIVWSTMPVQHSF